METLINDFVREHLAAFVVVTLAVLVAFAMLVWKMSALWYRFKHLPCDSHAETLGDLQKNKFDKTDLPCQTHGDKLAQHSVSVGRIDAALSFLTKNIEDMNIQLRQLNKTVPLTQQHSPLEISPRGWEVVERLGMSKMFNGNWDRIRKLIDEGVEDKSAYDINEFCIKYAVVFPEKFLSPEEVSVLKDDAYVQGLSLMDYMKIIAVMARDRYFEECGIKVEGLQQKLSPVATDGRG